MENNWLSLHAFVGDHQDSYLARVASLCGALRRDQLLDGFFYLRYWDGGPHLRLRFLPSSPARADHFRSSISGVLRSALPELPAPSADTVRIYQQQAAQFSKREGVPEGHAGAMRQQASLEIHPYVPELAKYGGEEGIALAHSVWLDSTSIALDVVSAQDRPKRLGLALTMLIVAARAFRFERAFATQWLNNYSAYWGAYCFDQPSPLSREQIDRQSLAVARSLGAVWNGDGALPHAAQLWRDALDRARIAIAASEPRLNAALSPTLPAGIAVPPYLLMQYVHTHNNRLGLSAADEHYISAIAARAMETIGHDHG